MSILKEHFPAIGVVQILQNLQHGSVVEIRIDFNAVYMVVATEQLRQFKKFCPGFFTFCLCCGCHAVQHGIVTARKPRAIDSIIGRLMAEDDGSIRQNGDVFLQHIAITGVKVFLNRGLVGISALPLVTTVGPALRNGILDNFPDSFQFSRKGFAKNHSPKDAK